MTLEKNGYAVTLYVHDKTIIEMPIAQSSQEEVCRLMAVVLPWAEELPLRAEEDEFPFHRK